MKRVLPTAITLLAVLAPAAAGQAQDLRAMVRRVVDNEIARDQADHSCWIFHEINRTADGSVNQWVAQTPAGDVHRVLEKDGQHFTRQQQQQAVEQFVHDQAAQAQQREDYADDDKKARTLLKLLPDAFRWHMESRNRASTVLHFSPDPAFNPPTHEARVFAAMEGTLTIDNAQQRVREFKGRLVNNVDFGFGLLGELDKGGYFRVERRDVGGGVWDITQLHIHVSGHALLFKSIAVQQDEVKTDFTREPDNVTLQQAAAAVMKR